MSDIILHHKGAYNIFCTNIDDLEFQEPLTLDELKTHYKYTENETHGFYLLKANIDKATEKGCSLNSGCIESAIANFLDVRQMTTDEFILEYLTFKNKGNI